MNTYFEILLGVFIFTTIISLLVFMIIIAKRKLVPSGKVQISINNDSAKSFETSVGGKLLNVLADNKYFVPSACGGGGTCAQCKVKIEDGGGEILPVELDHLNMKEKKRKDSLILSSSSKKRHEAAA